MEYEIDTWSWSDPDRLLDREDTDGARKPGVAQHHRPPVPHQVEQHALFIPEESEEAA